MKIQNFFLLLQDNMGVLIVKSSENLLSAKLLIENRCFNSSVHCSYYSSVQLMIHLLLNKFNFTQEKLEISAKSENKGSHVFAKNFLYNKMKEKNVRFKAVEFHREVGELKNKREQADYQEIEIDSDFSEDAYKQAEKVNEILEEIFELRK